MLGVTMAEMRVLEVIQRGAEFLARKGVESPRLDVELLMGHVLGMPRLKLYLDFDRELLEPDLNAIRNLVQRRGTREPLQHILGSAGFCGLEILVNRHVLIPRPETEVLAERAWEYLNALPTAGAEPVAALDFGTGSGCLALALARHAPAARIVALDVSGAALEVARTNAARLNLASRIEFYESDGFAAAAGAGRFHLIVANPPYIPTGEIEHLPPEVRDHDPRLALDGGPDGLTFLRKLAREAPQFLLPGGRLMCEFGDGQSALVPALFSLPPWSSAEVLVDLTGRPRILVARRCES